MHSSTSEEGKKRFRGRLWRPASSRTRAAEVRMQWPPAYRSANQIHVADVNAFGAHVAPQMLINAEQAAMGPKEG
jgi:hypothetical protein